MILPPEHFVNINKIENNKIENNISKKECLYIFCIPFSICLTFSLFLLHLMAQNHELNFNSSMI